MSINSAIGQVEKKTNKLVLKETKDYLLNEDSLSSKQLRQYKRHKEDIDDAILELFEIDTFEVNRLIIRFLMISLMGTILRIFQIHSDLK